MRGTLIGIALAALLVLAAGRPGDAPAKASTRIVWTSSGGIAGIDNRLVVGSDRRAVLTGRGRPSPGRQTFTRTLSRAAHARLLRIVTAAKIERLRSRYAPSTPVADGIDQTLSFHGRRVVVRQGSNPPKALRRALDELSKLAASLRKQ